MIKQNLGHGHPLWLAGWILWAATTGGPTASPPQDATPAPARPAAANPDEIAIRQILDAQVVAWNEGDLDSFMAGYWRSPELTFSAGGETTHGWQATLNRYRQRYPDRAKMGTLKFGQPEIRVLGRTAALVLGTWQLVTDQGSPRGNYTLVLEKQGTDWRIIHDHSSTLETVEADP